MHSQRVRPRLSFINAIAAEPGVEPELYISTPRRVVGNNDMRQWRVWCANLIAGFFAFAYYCCQRHWHDSEVASVIVTTVAGLVAVAW